jgi:hypothetical protein
VNSTPAASIAVRIASTVRSCAANVPGVVSRRLGAIIAAGAVGATLALPAVAATSDAPSHHPEAELFALIERARTADALVDEATMATDDVWDKTAPSFPQALIWTEADAPHWCGVIPGQQISARDIDFLRDWLNLARKPDPIARGVRLPAVVPTVAFVERAREIVRTKDEYEAARQAGKEHPDVLEAEAQYEALQERWRELAMRVATTPAKTPEGLVAKLAMIAPAYADDALEGTYDGILVSAALDAQALALKAGEART